MISLSSRERENFHLQEKRKTLLAIIFSSLSSSYFVLEKLYHLTLLVCVSVYVSILFQTVDNNYFLSYRVYMQVHVYNVYVYIRNVFYNLIFRT